MASCTRRSSSTGRLVDLDLRRIFAGPIDSGTVDTVLVDDSSSLYSHLRRRVENDGLSELRAERITGSMQWLALHGNAAWWNPRTARERRRELRELGLGATAGNDAARTPVDAVLRGAVDVWPES